MKIKTNSELAELISEHGIELSEPKKQYVAILSRRGEKENKSINLDEGDANVCLKTLFRAMFPEKDILCVFFKNAAMHDKLDKLESDKWGGFTKGSDIIYVSNSDLHFSNPCSFTDDITLQIVRGPRPTEEEILDANIESVKKYLIELSDKEQKKIDEATEKRESLLITFNHLIGNSRDISKIPYGKLTKSEKLSVSEAAKAGKLFVNCPSWAKDDWVHKRGFSFFDPCFYKIFE